MMNAAVSKRLKSIDALRGFDMFWIIGGAAVFDDLCGLFGGGLAAGLSAQMYHVEWEGLHFIDCVFPVFVFIAGLSFPFSHASQVERGVPRLAMHLRVLKRALALVALGVVYNGFLSADWHGLADFRYSSVLGKIGIAWGVAALVYMHTKARGRVAWFLGGLLAYGLLLQVTAPDAPAGASPTSLHGCFMGWLDRHFTPGALYCDNVLEPSGPFVSFFCYPTALLGMIVGDVVRSRRLAPGRNALLVALVGATCVAAGCALSPAVPIVKKLWTPTFALVTAGCGAMLFALFHYLVDVRGWARWSFPFQVIGMNAIAVYVGSEVFDFTRMSAALFGGLASVAGPCGHLALSSGRVLAEFAALHFLYRKQVFFKV